MAPQEAWVCPALSPGGETTALQIWDSILPPPGLELGWPLHALQTEASNAEELAGALLSLLLKVRSRAGAMLPVFLRPHEPVHC